MFTLDTAILFVEIIGANGAPGCFFMKCILFKSSFCICHATYIFIDMVHRF